MKASVKVRDSGLEPLVRAKIPISICGMPISTGITMGSSHDLGLHISTLLNAGPSCRLGFMPNDPQTPLRLTLRAGFGPWASPNPSPIIISIHLNLPLQQHHHQHKPTLSFSIKPRSGDFVLCKHLKKIQLQKSHEVEVDELPKPVSVAELAKVFDRSKKNVHEEEDEGWVLPETGGPTAGLNMNSASPPPFCKGWSLAAHSRLPLGQRVAAGFRWRMGVPEDLIRCLASDPQRLFARRSLPVLRLDKVSLEFRDEEVTCKKPRKVVAAEGCTWMEENEELNKVAVMCSSMRRQLHVVYVENQMLRSTMEEMKANFSGWKNSVEDFAGRPQVNSALVSSRQEDRKVKPPPRQEDQKVKAPPHRQEDQSHKVKSEQQQQQQQVKSEQQQQQQQVKSKEEQDRSSARKTPAADIAKELQRAIVAGKSS